MLCSQLTKPSKLVNQRTEMATCTVSDFTACASSRLTSSITSFCPPPSSEKNIRPPRTRLFYQLQGNLCSFHYCYRIPSCRPLKKASATRISITMATKEVLPPALDSTSEPPPIFDGTTRLYISYTCPYAQRVWVTRNCKGLQERIKLVPIDLKNRPDWYKEKVYPPNKVPALEHNNEVKGESLDLIKYIDSHFEGPSLFPDDSAKKELAEELFSYTDSFNKTVMTAMKGDANEASAAFDHVETALSKFNDGPFFLGQFSLVDIAYAPFIDRFLHFLLNEKNYDITAGRPKLAAWIEEMNKNEAFNQTRRNPKELVEIYKSRFQAQL